VVNVRTESVLDLREIPEWGQYGDQLDKLFKEYFGKAYSAGFLEYNSIGSGVVVGEKGWIVTNAHVVDKAKNIFVALKDGTILKARVLKINRPDDLAIIQVDLPYPIKPIPLADSSSIMIGETAIAIGDSLGLQNSVTAGVISGKDRSFSKTECAYSCTGLLQTDASINPGNSGGALLNLNGELMGINLAVVQNAQSVGFAIPADKIRNLLDELKSR
jgi:serine protease Do